MLTVVAWAAACSLAYHLGVIVAHALNRHTYHPGASHGT